MKKLLSLLAFVAVLSVNAQTTKYVIYPFGAAQGFTIAPSGTVAVTVNNQMAYPSAVPTLTDNITYSVTVGTAVKAGAQMLLTIKTTSTETTTFAGSIVAPVVTGAAGKTWSQAFIYNGTKFYPVGAKIQVD